MEHHTVFDWSRRQRTGVPEVVFAEGKANAQLLDILDAHEQHDDAEVVKRVDKDEKMEEIDQYHRK